MRNSVPIALASMLLLAACSPASRDGAESGAPGDDTRRAADLAAIERLHAADMKAVVAGDTATLMALWTDDIVALPPVGPIQIGRAANAAFMRQGMQLASAFTPLEYHLEFQQVELFGDHAVEWGTYRGRSRAKAGGAEVIGKGKVMRVLRRQPDGSWKVARTMFTVE